MEVVFWLPMVLLKVPCFLNWVQAKEKTNRSKKGERRKRQDDTKSETWQFFPLSHISSPIFFTSLLPIRSMKPIWNFQLTFALSWRNLYRNEYWRNGCTGESGESIATRCSMLGPLQNTIVAPCSTSYFVTTESFLCLVTCFLTYLL